MTENLMPRCAQCGQSFDWGQAYLCRETPGIDGPPPGLGSWGATAYCPGCGALVAEWLEADWRGKEGWAWYGENSRLNAGVELPASPILYWGKSILRRFTPLREERRIDLQALRKYEEAAPVVRESETRDWESVFEDAKRLSRDGDPSMAIDRVEQAASLGLPTLQQAQAYGGIGLQFAIQDDLDRALEYCRRSIQIEPSADWQSHYLLGLVQQACGDPAVAKKHFADARRFAGTVWWDPAYEHRLSQTVSAQAAKNDVAPADSRSASEEPKAAPSMGKTFAAIQASGTAISSDREKAVEGSFPGPGTPAPGLPRPESTTLGSSPDAAAPVGMAIDVAVPGSEIRAQVDKLIFALKDTDPSSHKGSIEEMIDLGPTAVAPLLDYLRHPDSWARLMAVAALGKMRDGRAIEPIRLLKEDADPGVRHLAEVALGEILKTAQASEPAHGQEAEPGGEAQEAEEVPSSGTSVTSVVEDQDDPIDVRAKVEALVSGATEGASDPAAVSERLVALGAAAVEPLIGYLRHPNPLYRFTAIHVLGLLKDRRAVAPLQAVASSDPKDDIREHARMAGVMLSLSLRDPSAYFLDPAERSPLADWLPREEPPIGSASVPVSYKRQTPSAAPAPRGTAKPVRSAARSGSRRRGLRLLVVLLGVILVGAGIFLVQSGILRAGPPSPAVILPPTIERPLAKSNSVGLRSAPLVLEVFSDFQCAQCRAFHDRVEVRLLQDYVASGELLITFRSLGALLGDESQLAAEAAYCASDQSQFWAYHDLLFANQAEKNSGAFSPPRLQAFAEALGLDGEAFGDCVGSHKYQKRVEAEALEATRRGVVGAPAFFLNRTTKIEGAQVYVVFQRAIEAARQPAEVPTETMTPPPAWIEEFAAPILAVLEANPATFEDDFSTMSGRFLRWSVMSSGVVQEEGVLRLSTVEGSASVGGPLVARDFVLQLDFTQRGDDGDLRVEIFFRQTGRRHYTLIVRLGDSAGTSEWSILSSAPDQPEPVELVHGQVAGIAADEPSRVILIAKGAEFAFYLDGQPVAYFTDGAHTGDGNVIGIAGTGAVDFDNVRFWDLAAIP